jgi:hypothetical protein
MGRFETYEGGTRKQSKGVGSAVLRQAHVPNRRAAAASGDLRKSAFDERSTIGKNFGEPAQLTYIAFKLFQIEEHLRTMASAAESSGKAKR